MQNIVTIHRPELTAEEHAHRMEQIKEAATLLILTTEKHQQGKEKRE